MFVRLFNMRILRNVLLILVPVVLLINLYVFASVNGSKEVFTFKGVSYVHQYISTFPGVSTTINVLHTIETTSSAFASYEISSLVDLISAVASFFTMVGLVFSLPITILVDIVRNVLWFLNLFFIQ